MKNKVIYTFMKKTRDSMPPDNSMSPDNSEEDSIIEQNGDMYESVLFKKLKNYKNQITVHHRSKLWDTAKRYTNPYELVNRSPPPVSRSFFKLWEILHDFPDILERSPKTALLLAEGPGGFVQALGEVSNTIKTFFCNTLISSQRSVPVWKIPTTSMVVDPSKKYEFLSGSDSTGDLYSLANVDDIVNKVRIHGGADIVTADGGFDFSSNYNTQEQASLPLLISEVLVALSSLNTGGSLILKIFDVSVDKTIALIDILIKSFESVVATKPFTSRMANSEKYLVCRGFLSHSSEEISDLRRFSTEFVKWIPVVDCHVKGQVRCMNDMMINQQITNISKTLELIKKPITSDIICEHASRQRENAVLWYRYYFSG